MRPDRREHSSPKSTLHRGAAGRRPRAPDRAGAGGDAVPAPIPVLDHGFVRVIDYMGDDAAIVQAARVSYGRGTRRVSEDAGLIRYLMRHRHSHAVRDVRDQVPREAADLRGAAVDPPPHRQRERVFRALLDPGPGVLHPGARAPGGAIRGNRQGRGECWTGDEAAEVLDLLRDDATAQLRPLRRDAERG